MNKDKKPVNFRPIGVSGLERYGPYIYEEFLPELRWPMAGRIYKEMADNDPVIGAILYLAEMLIRGTHWSVEAGGDSSVDIKAAEFLQSCMNDMEMSWDNTICEILSMLTYGFSFHEIVYKVRRGPNERNPQYHSRYNDGRIGWRKLPIRSQQTLYQWEFNDETNEVTAFLQQAAPDYKVRRIPIDKGLLFLTKSNRENPEGRSLLRNAYRPWFFKKHFEEIEGIGIERDLAGFPVLQAPDQLDLWNDDDPQMIKLRRQAEELVASVRRDSNEGVLLPFGWDLKLLSSPSGRQINISDTVDRYDNRIAITMLSDIILIGQKSGSFALADTKQSMLAASLQAQVQNIADEFNSKAVPELFRYNTFRGLKELPQIVPGQINTPSLKEVALILRAMGTNISGDQKLMNYLRHIIGMPKLDNETFEAIYRRQGDPKEEGTMQHNDIVDTSTEPSGLPSTADGTVTPDDTVDNDFEQTDMAYTGG